MKSFLKIFLASFTALVIFTVIGVFLLFIIIGGLSSRDEVKVDPDSVLVLDLSRRYAEQEVENPAAMFNSNESNIPGLFDVVRLIRKAETDKRIRGIYLKCGMGANGMAASMEIRRAIMDFKRSKKFVIAYGDVLGQGSYGVATAADKLYCNPAGGVDWKGFSMQMMFMKEMFRKLEVEPQVFHAGKFKSARELFEEDKMSAANREQTTQWLGELYAGFLARCAEGRQIDSATLRGYASSATIQTAADALKFKLVDGLKYDDEVKQEIHGLLGLKKGEKVSFIKIDRYKEAVSLSDWSSGDKIAMVFAEGEIVYGRGEEGEVGSDELIKVISAARTDKSVKAIVLRVNSPGGSALASEIIWRELDLARKDKPVVVSMGDLAASGGYYISCMADSIFIEPATLTGSIGVFAVAPNLQGLFKNKLGISFESVRTGPYADMGNGMRPLTEPEKRLFQAGIDSGYILFKSRVAAGRKIDIGYVDSIAQGRVWAGATALDLGLADRMGGMQDAIDCAARMAGLKKYRIREFPEPAGFFDKVFGEYKSSAASQSIKEELGTTDYELFLSLRRLRSKIGTVQMRMPFDLRIGN